MHCAITCVPFLPYPDCKALQREVKTVQTSSGTQVPAGQDTYLTSSLRKAQHIMTDPSHTAQWCFSLIPTYLTGPSRLQDSGNFKYRWVTQYNPSLHCHLLINGTLISAPCYPCILTGHLFRRTLLVLCLTPFCMQNS